MASIEFEEPDDVDDELDEADRVSWLELGAGPFPCTPPPLPSTRLE